MSTISFAMAAYDHSKPLVIDPAMVYSTYLGGVTNQGNVFTGAGIAAFTDSTGYTYGYITGETCSSDFPTVNANHPTYGACAMFTSKLAASRNNSLKRVCFFVSNASTLLRYSDYSTEVNASCLLLRFCYENRTPLRPGGLF